MMKLPSFNWKFKICGKSTVSLVDQPIFKSGDEGRRVWEGGIVFSRFVLRNSVLFRNKKVLELGSGGGIAGISILKYTNASHVTFSDYKESLFPLIELNIQSNLPEGPHKHITTEFKCISDSESYISQSEIEKSPIATKIASYLKKTEYTLSKTPLEFVYCPLCCPNRKKIELIDWSKAPAASIIGAYDIIVGSDIIYKGSNHDLLYYYLNTICTSIVIF